MQQPLQIISVITILKCGGKFLLVKRSEQDEVFPGKWQNLGGKVELGETIENAVKREINEETGLKIKNHQPLFIQSYSWKKDISSPVRLGLIFMISLEGETGSHKIILNSELANFSWFTFEEIKKMNQTNSLIGKDSSTGTFGQLSQAKKFLKKRSSLRLIGILLKKNHRSLSH